MLALGDSVCCPSPPQSPPHTPEASNPSSPQCEREGVVAAGAAGRVRLKRCKVADNYTMGKVLEQGEVRHAPPRHHLDSPVPRPTPKRTHRSANRPARSLRATLRPSLAHLLPSPLAPLPPAAPHTGRPLSLQNLIVVEGFHRKTRCSHVLKIVSKGSAHFKQIKRDGCSMHANGPELISRCIEEVYEGPNHACLVMKWGTHELDTDHHLAAAVLEALRLLHELLPDTVGADGDGANIMLRGDDAHRLVRRVLTLDRLLQANLFG